jgi:chaperonin cofactor prefoldin
MSFTVPLQSYARGPQPALPESQLQYLQLELKKIEQMLQTVVDALKELDSRVTTLEGP